jgi:8-oxo-dGTP pyrophosphatase MutT (NUDIX family)
MKIKALSAGVVVVHRGAAEPWRFLLLRAYRNWDFPKGVVEAGEAPFTAACREVEEETSLRGLQFLWGEIYKETEAYGRGKVARYYLAAAPTDRVELRVSPELGRPEHHEYRWCEYDAARVLLVPRTAAVLDWAQEQIRDA